MKKSASKQEADDEQSVAEVKAEEKAEAKAEKKAEKEAAEAEAAAPSPEPLASAAVSPEPAGSTCTAVVGQTAADDAWWRRYCSHRERQLELVEQQRVWWTVGICIRRFTEFAGSHSHR